MSHRSGAYDYARGNLVVFAAKHGETALDGEGGDSPFAIAMVQRIATPGVEINKIFRLVRDDVMEATACRRSHTRMARCRARRTSLSWLASELVRTGGPVTSAVAGRELGALQKSPQFLDLNDQP
jgi:uncharacterized caspase-like protein